MRELNDFRRRITDFNAQTFGGAVRAQNKLGLAAGSQAFGGVSVVGDGDLVKFGVAKGKGKFFAILRRRSDRFSARLASITNSSKRRFNHFS